MEHCFNPMGRELKFNIYKTFRMPSKRLTRSVYILCPGEVILPHLLHKKSTVSCGFGHIYWRNPQWKTSFFVQWFILYFNTIFRRHFKQIDKLFIDLVCVDKKATQNILPSADKHVPSAEVNVSNVSKHGPLTKLKPLEITKIADEKKPKQKKRKKDKENKKSRQSKQTIFAADTFSNNFNNCNNNELYDDEIQANINDILGSLWLFCTIQFNIIQISWLQTKKSHIPTVISLIILASWIRNVGNTSKTLCFLNIFYLFQHLTFWQTYEFDGALLEFFKDFSEQKRGFGILRKHKVTSKLNI